MKKLIILSVCIVAALGIKAQQLAQWTQFAQNEYTVNPAVAGADEYFHATTMFRNQWAGITDGPRTYYLSVDGPVWGDRMGIGGSVINDVTGAIRKAGMQLSYAYHLKLTPDAKLSLSLSGGLFQWSVNGAELDLDQKNDIAISNGNMVDWIPDFGFGARFSTKKFHAGFYIPQITNSKIQLFNDYHMTGNALERHYYVNLGYRHDFNDNFGLQGNFFSRYVSPVFMQEFQLVGIIKESISLGASVRMPIQEEIASAIGFLAGYQFQNNMMIGYSYDLDLGRVGVASNGSHEVMLSIRFTRKNSKPPDSSFGIVGEY